jgi:hypothetical protein
MTRTAAMGGRGGEGEVREATTFGEKYLRMLAGVDALVPNEDMDNGGDGGGSNGIGGNCGNKDATNFILSPLIGDVIKKTTRAYTGVATALSQSNNVVTYAVC